MPNHGTSHCHVEPLEKRVDPDAVTDASVAVLRVWGMGCPTCALRVRNGLLQHPAVLVADISLHDGLATVMIDESRVTMEDLVYAVARAGIESGHRYSAVVVESPTTR